MDAHGVSVNLITSGEVPSQGQGQGQTSHTPFDYDPGSMMLSEESEVANTQEDTEIENVFGDLYQSLECSVTPQKKKMTRSQY